jgi:phage tail sheath gpL-like
LKWKTLSNLFRQGVFLSQIYTPYPMGNNAVAQNRVSAVVGYLLSTGNFATASPFLPQRIAMFGEANHANQGLSTLTTPTQITSAKQAGDLYGYGSPLHIMSRILFPVTGNGGIGSVPLWAYPQAEAGSATSKKIEITPSGVATANGTHYLAIAGREGLDGQFYALNIVVGDNAATISQKIANAVNAILGCPMTAVATPYVCDLESKWKGLTADALSITVDTGTPANSLGITYGIASIQSGSATPDVTASLNLFQDIWNTLVINSYGTNTTVMASLEAFNGVPDPVNPTGRFVGIVMKPFTAVTGSTDDDPSAITDARLNQLTIAIAPAPRSAGLSMEAAANMIVLAMYLVNDPELDVQGMKYPDMPTPLVIGSMADYNNRDIMVQKGCSTVVLSAGQYKIKDFVTTWHPVGEIPPQFRYVRNFMIDLNIRFMYHILEMENVENKVIAADADQVAGPNIVKPKQWKQIIDSFAKELVAQALVTDANFMQASVTVALNPRNPDRFDTFFKYKRTGFARILSTQAQAGFNFGTTN